jgi:hypothetical protein
MTIAFATVVAPEATFLTITFAAVNRQALRPFF